MPKLSDTRIRAAKSREKPYKLFDSDGLYLIVGANNARWWRFRVPGYGAMDWKGFFSVLADAGYTGAMNIENEDEFYYPAYSQGNFTEQFKRGFRVAHEFLKTLVPPVTA